MLIVVGFTSPSATALAGDSCAERFPETAWVPVHNGPVSIEATGVTPGLAGRFTRATELVEGCINEEIGAVSLTLCLAENDSDVDVTPYVSGSQRFHPHGDGRATARDQHRAGGARRTSHCLVDGSSRTVASRVGASPHPEPISSVVGQWYRARILDRLDLYHRDVMVENFFDSESVVGWTETEQPQVLDWDPEQNLQTVGDFIDFAVSEHGTEVLVETDGARWSEIEPAWRVALRADLTCRTTPTTEWVVGVGIVTVLLVVTAIGLGLWSKHRRRERPDTAPAIPGFFSDS